MLSGKSWCSGTSSGARNLNAVLFRSIVDVVIVLIALVWQQKMTPYVTEGKNEVHFLICQGNLKFTVNPFSPSPQLGIALKPNVTDDCGR